MMESFERVRSALESVGCRVQEKGSTVLKAQCPAHDDKEPSLSVSWSNDRTLIRCHAACQNDDIVTALGLEFGDLFDAEPERAEGPLLVRTYTYRTADGDPWIVKERYYPKTFRLRRAEDPVGSSHGLRGRAMILYRLPEVLAGIREGRTPWVVEGEKDVETAEQHGILATCFPAINGQWDERFFTTLAGAGEVVVVADQDPPNKNGVRPGAEFAAKVRDGLRAAGAKVRVVKAKEGKDLTDHFRHGHGVDDFVADLSISVRPRGMDAYTLTRTEFPALNWAIPDMLPAGLGILAGSPKAGKSFMVLDFCASVAAGGQALGGVQARRGSVLYLAREDGYRRLQSRLDVLFGGKRYALDADLSKLEVIPTEEAWMGGMEGIAAMTEWADEVGDPLLVVLDTLAKVEPSSEDGDRYRQDYAMMARYKTWADRHNVAVLAVHHDRKSNDDSGDIFSKISGTKGITGAVDTMMYLERKRGEPTGTLHLTGRDVADQEVELRKSGPLWVAMDPIERAYLRPVG